MHKYNAQYATIEVNGNFLGAQAKINIWKPVTETPSEISVSQIWVTAGDDDVKNTIEAGWIVNDYVYNDDQPRFFIFWTDQIGGHWWVHLQGIAVGYYPSSLFTKLSKTSTRIIFGGEIFNGKSKGQHTSTQMGSGHFPSEGGLKISSYFNWVQVVDENYVTKDPKNVETRVTNSDCYDLKVDDENYDTNGYGFYYGGPGYNEKCR
ncbi:uncharacterized protein LOC113351992 [Papaver somniferum]|uniref:uncharacterized protein LOC113351992 n=1 Tax=Papaver somniferum TaxID=3469 RepID=UPI000E7047E8|nr:uncharacterized protein LOC113351992 [Papaver somniferum]